MGELLASIIGALSAGALAKAGDIGGRAVTDAYDGLRALIVRKIGKGGAVQSVARLIDLGVIGINFEDLVVKGEGHCGIDRQARRISAIRTAAERKGIALFINTTDRRAFCRRRSGAFCGRGSRQGQSIRRCWRLRVLYPRLERRSAHWSDL